MIFIWAATQKNLSLGVRKQHRRKPACTSAQSDQHHCYLLLCKLATGEISIFLLVSVAEGTGLKLALSENPEDRFS